MSEQLSFETIPCLNNKTIIKITLQRPAALNALTLTMVQRLNQALPIWIEDPNIVALLIEGDGDRAFCAGGDIREMYHHMSEDAHQPCPEVEHFFQEEYRLDYSLHRSTTPIIAWGDGLCMGGGLGIFRAAQHRVATESSRFAMPEITIGLYPDVGASYFFNQMPSAIGRFLGLTGVSFNAADALDIGIAHHLLPNSSKNHLIQRLQTLPWSSSAEEHNHQINHILSDLEQSSRLTPPIKQIAPHQSSIEALFETRDTAITIQQFLRHESDDPWMRQAQQMVQKGSPLSLFITDELLKRGKTLTLAAAFQLDVILSTHCARFTEFREGVRALLIDKDHQPRWHFSNMETVDQSFVEHFFVAPWDHNPLEDLSW